MGSFQSSEEWWEVVVCLSVYKQRMWWWLVISFHHTGLLCPIIYLQPAISQPVFLWTGTRSKHNSGFDLEPVFPSFSSYFSNLIDQLLQCRSADIFLHWVTHSGSQSLPLKQWPRSLPCKSYILYKHTHVDTSSAAAVNAAIRQCSCHIGIGKPRVLTHVCPWRQEVYLQLRSF